MSHEIYENPLISRYASREMATLFERVAPGVPVAVTIRPDMPLDARVALELAGFRVLTKPGCLLIAQERTNEEIADVMHVSVDTVKTHRKNLMTKLNVRNTAGLVRYAVDRCWV